MRQSQQSLLYTLLSFLISIHTHNTHTPLSPSTTEKGEEPWLAAKTYVWLMDLPGASAYGVFNGAMFRSLLALIKSWLEAAASGGVDASAGGSSAAAAAASTSSSAAEQQSSQSTAAASSQGTSSRSRRAAATRRPAPVDNDDDDDDDDDEDDSGDEGGRRGRSKRTTRGAKRYVFM